MLMSGFSRARASLAAIAARLGLRPNSVTLASMVFAVLSGFAAAAGFLPGAAVLFAVSGLCDALDGPLARGTKSVTPFGALLDSTLDRIADAAPLTGLVYFYAPHPLAATIPALAVIGAFTISYIRARAASLGVELGRLWMRRGERVAITGIALLVGPISIPGLSIEAPVTLFLAAVLTILQFAATVAALRAAQKAFEK